MEALYGFPKGKLAGGGFDFQDWAKPKPRVVSVDEVNDPPRAFPKGNLKDEAFSFDFVEKPNHASFPFGNPWED